MESQDATTMVAVSKHRSSVSAIRWALSSKLVGPGGCIKLVHVRPPVRFIPDPRGGSVPIERVSRELVAAYMLDVESETYEQLQRHQKICHAWKVKVELVIVESDDVAAALLDQITRTPVKNFVIGTSVSNTLMWKFKGFSLSGHILKHALESCTIYVVSKGNLVSTREGKIQKSDKTNDAKDPHMNGRHARLSSLDIDGGRDPNSINIEELREMKRFISQPLSIQRDKAASAINLKSVVSDVGHGLENFPGTMGERGSQVASPFWSPNLRFKSSQHSWHTLDNKELGVSAESLSSQSTDGGESAMFVEDTITCARDKERLKVHGSVRSLSEESLSLAMNEETQGSSPRAIASNQNSRSVIDLPEDQQVAEMQAGTQLGSDLEKLKVELELAQKRVKMAEEAAAVATQRARELNAYAKTEAQKREQAVIVARLARQTAAKEARNFEKALMALESVRLVGEEEARKRRKAEERAYHEALSRQRAVAALIKGQTRYMEYDYDDLKKATNGFAEENQLGEGGYGKVFLGNLHHTTVAIKVLKKSGVQGPQEFQREVEILSRMHHPNMVLLLGACSEHSCLIYEYLANGSLEDRLLCKGNSPPLPWHVRFRVAAEVATALLFLHASKPDPIVHRDLKPGNILLDQNFVSKIGDVGLARLVPGIVSYSVTEYRDTTPVGTFAYIDPEYQRTGVFCPRSDVYALGIVILQLLTGRGPIGLTTIVEMALEEKSLQEILDPSAGNWPMDEASELAHLALQCSEMRRKHRPDLEMCVLPKLTTLRVFADEFDTQMMWNNQCVSEGVRVVPSFFLCPILKEVMQDPHIAADGYTYEYGAIKQWLQSNNTSPMTNLKLTRKHLTPNHSLRSAIYEWSQKLA